MQFELKKDNSASADVVLERGERRILNQALLEKLLKAATVGPPIDRTSTLHHLIINLLHPDRMNGNNLCIAADQAEEMQRVIVDVTPNLRAPLDDVVIPFLATLNVAARTLRYHTPADTIFGDSISAAEIDRQTSGFTAPDSPRDLFNQ